MLVLVLVIFSLCLNFSKQDLLYNLALEQGLNFTDAEDILEYGKHGIKRQANVLLRSGIPQTKICGINGNSLSRLRRREKPEDRPQGREDWPWMAVFFLKKDNTVWYCGGSLLNSRYVLTAAHCFTEPANKDASSSYVRLGEFDILREGETEIQDYEIEEIISHPDYDRGTQRNDIAIVKLNQTVEYTQFVRPICLPNAEPQPDEDTIVAGWGRIEEKKDKSHLLLYVDIPVWDHDECVDAMTQPVHETNICAASKTGGKDSCKGDSGGPLMYQARSKRWENVGIVSWGNKCGEAYPGIYTSVLKYLQWIGGHISNAAP